jgi:MoxR-like ATPase
LKLENANSNDVQLVEKLSASVKDIKQEIGKVIIGQDLIIDNLLISLFARGHCLLVGVPGLAKTLLIKTLSEVLDLKFNRIQFTPDTLPSDITGLSIYNMQSGIFEYSKGAIMNNIILADEINRTSPKTQASLLEAMEEKQVYGRRCYLSFSKTLYGNSNTEPNRLPWHL